MKVEELTKEIESSKEELLNALALMQQQMMMLPKGNRSHASNVIQARFRILSMKFEDYSRMLSEYTGCLMCGRKGNGQA